MKTTAIALAVWLAAAGSPALGTDWQLVAPDVSSLLWWDTDEVPGLPDDETYVYFYVYHGEWAGPDAMTQNARILAYDCDLGDAFVWNAYSQAWDFSSSYTEDPLLSELAFELCWS